MKDLSKLKVAIVHDWLVGGGAERVVLELHRMFPDAPIYTSYCTPEWRQRLDGKVVTGWLQHFGKLRKFMVLGRIWWFEHLDLSGYDLVISSSGNGEAKAVKTPDSTLHVCYCHSPTHFYWRHYDQYVAHPGFGPLDGLARWGLRTLVGPLRRWDQKAAQRPDYMIANSTHIKADIKTYYGRNADVVFPPVDVEHFKPSGYHQKTGFVTLGRQATYKRTDIIVDACTQLDAHLKVIGRGPDHIRLSTMAGPTVRFLTNVSDEEKPDQLASAEAFLFAAHEDFGVAPVEAMAVGLPVIAYHAGGALDYVVPGKTGLFFEEQTTDSLIDAIAAFRPEDYDPKAIRRHAQKFSADKFATRMRKLLTSYLKKR